MDVQWRDGHLRASRVRTSVFFRPFDTSFSTRVGATLAAGSEGPIDAACKEYVGDAPDERLATMACQVTCGTCPQCHDDVNFFAGYKKKDKYKTCFWVGEDRDARCRLQGQSGKKKKMKLLLAYEACPVQCHMCKVECEDNPLWYVKKNPDKDGCSSITEKNIEKVCNKKGKIQGDEKGGKKIGWSLDACPVTCDECPEEWPTPNPTPVPTPVPTPFPTKSPTSFPTPVPTPVPTPFPTPETAPPTLSPTFFPTPVPTPVPTPLPTSFPTSFPTPVPTPVPTPFPTESPTLFPTPVPTPVPTPFPSPVPTRWSFSFSFTPGANDCKVKAKEECKGDSTCSWASGKCNVVANAAGFADGGGFGSSAGYYGTCGKKIKDNKSWFYRGKPKNDCKSVAAKSLVKRRKFCRNEDIEGEGGLAAADACPKACKSCNTCVDDKKWRSKPQYGVSFKCKDMVADPVRCHFKSAAPQRVKAMDACAASCDPRCA